MLETFRLLVQFYDEGVELTRRCPTRSRRPDLEAMTFLKDSACASREFWARRQAHETTIHKVDAQSALLGRVPSATRRASRPRSRPTVSTSCSAGSSPRGKSKLFDGKPFVAVVAPDDVDRRWVLRVDERLSVDAGDDDVDDADARLSGSAAALYLALWNRGDEIDVRGRPDVLDRWHEVQRVTWS